MKDISLDDLQHMENPLLVDVRTPGEFREDHLPGAINVPVISGSEREEVGTIYRDDPFRARKRGARMIAERLPDLLDQIERRLAETSENPQNHPVVLYCWRGGLRSDSLGLVLDRIGYHIHRLKGGYRSFRHRIRTFFEHFDRKNDIVTLFGKTGAGKTELLTMLEDRGENVLDLEDHANHRGSAFGSVGKGEQPSQKRFERNLFLELRPEPNAPIFTEGESRNIGDRLLPDNLFEALLASPKVYLRVPLETRVTRIIEEYDNIRDRDELLDRMERLENRTGTETVRQWQNELKEKNVRSVVRDLLETYYDPAYENSGPAPADCDRIIEGSNLEDAAASLRNMEHL